MGQFDKELKMYAENGLRTVADWLSVGREVEADSKPRSNVDWRGQSIDLFSRDQTQPRPASVRRSA